MSNNYQKGYNIIIEMVTKLNSCTIIIGGNYIIKTLKHLDIFQENEKLFFTKFLTNFLIKCLTKFFANFLIKCLTNFLANYLINFLIFF